MQVYFAKVFSGTVKKGLNASIQHGMNESQNIISMKGARSQIGEAAVALSP